MDYRKALEELKEERARLDEAIAIVEQLINPKGAKAPAKRRGRKAMPPEERAQVSERMKKYWAARRGAAVAAD